MKATELKKYLEECIKLNPTCECFINGSPIGVNADDVGDVDLYEVSQ